MADKSVNGVNIGIARKVWFTYGWRLLLRSQIVDRQYVYEPNHQENASMHVTYMQKNYAFQNQSN